MGATQTNRDEDMEVERTNAGRGTARSRSRLVEASTHDDALATGKAVFDRLVGADPHAAADHYVCFDEDETSVAGKAQWGELPTAAPVDSDDGQDLLERGWAATKGAFERNVERVNDALDELSDGEIVRDEYLARHAFHRVDAYDGPTSSLYNEHPNGTRHREQLDRVLRERGPLDRIRRRPLLTDVPVHKLAARNSHADARVPEHRDWWASRPASSPGLLPIRVAWRGPRRRLSNLVARVREKGRELVL